MKEAERIRQKDREMRQKGCKDKWYNYIYPPQAVKSFQISGRTVTHVFSRWLYDPTNQT